MSENKNAKTPADGPVAWSCQCGRPYTVTCISSKPQKKEWVGLTDAEKKGFIDAVLKDGDYGIFGLLAAIEAKLKDKNGG
jgi:hypothetical protein